LQDGTHDAASGPQSQPDQQAAAGRAFDSSPQAIPDLQQRSAGVAELIRPCDIKGILHSHSRWGDGAHSLEAMVQIAREIGLQYLGISDHFRSEHHADGLDLPAIAIQRQEIEELNQRFPDFDILQGVELDANLDGSLPLDDATLLMFDYVLASLPTNGNGDAEMLTERALRVLDNALVTVLAKPVGDFMLRQPPVPIDMERVLRKAAETRTAVEIDANPHSLDLDWGHCRLAQELGVYLAISPDAHRAARLVDYRHGAELARDAGICCRHVLNSMSSIELRAYLRSQR
jgi:DNA polymerase (family 10)